MKNINILYHHESFYPRLIVNSHQLV